MIQKLQPVAKLYLLVTVFSAFIIGMGIYGIVQVRAMYRNTGTLYADRILPVQQLGSIRFYYEQILYTAGQADGISVGYSNAYSQLQQAQDSINANWQAYLRTYFTEREKILAGQANRSVTALNADINLLKTALKNTNKAGLHHIMTGSLKASLATVIAEMSQLLQLQLKVSSDIYQSSRSVYRTLLIRFIGIISLSLIFVLPFSRYLIKNIRNIINALHDSNQYIHQSEEKYRYLFDHSPAYITIWDPETLAILEVNDQTTLGYGYSKNEFEQMSILDIAAAKEFERIKSYASNILKGSVPVFTGQWLHAGKGNKQMLVDITSHDIIYKNRKAVLSLGTDVTEKVQAQLQLQKSEQLFRALVDHAADGIFMVADDGLIFDVNRSASELFGYRKEEMIGMTVMDLHPSEKRPEIPSLRGRLRQEKYITDERYMLRKDGSLIQVMISRSMLPDASGAIAIVRDITEQKNAENRLRMQNEKLIEIAFLQSHIMRRPAANIIGLASLLNKNNLADPLNHEVIQMLEVSAFELDEVIHQIIEKIFEMNK